MRLLVHYPRLSRLLAALMLSFGLTGMVAPAAWAVTAKQMPHKQMAHMEGWVRLAHLSPNTPAVDVYLYSFSSPHAELVLHRVAYGLVSAYRQVPAGEYTVAMRVAGAPANSTPAMSMGVHVMAGGAYTVAGMGPASSVRLQVMRDQLVPPRGKILIRVIQASMRQPTVKVTAGHEVLARKLVFGQLSRYRVANPGMWTFRAVGGSERTSRMIKLVPNCIHTIVILDGVGHLKVDDLLDSAGSMMMPMGAVKTGLGGTAPRPAPSAAPWLVALGAGGLLALSGGVLVRRARRRPLHARVAQGMAR